MALENKLGLEDSAELARVEEKISKRNALELFASGRLESFPAGKFATLAEIHRALFGEIYNFAGKIRTVNDWSRVDKADYLSAMEISPIHDGKIKKVLAAALTDKVDDRELFMKGLDASYFYENYFAYRARDL